MTDKQIIINGVDVSKCKLYRDKVSFANGMTITDVCSIWIWQRDYSGLEPSCIMKCHCSNNSNCYYKQLERKEQECERLNEERNEYFELMAIRTEVLAKIANKLGINTGIIENKEIFNKIDQLKNTNKELRKESNISITKINECEVLNDRPKQS